MKSLKQLTLALALLFASNAIHSQVSINVNLGSQPSWGPSGYSNVNYYYLPDVQAYYDVNASQFIYNSGGIWIRSGFLPRQYRNYDLYSGYKVVLNDYHGSRPYVNYRYDKVKYFKGYNRPQRAIGRREEHHDNNDHDNGREHESGRGNEGHGNNGHGKGRK